MQVLATVIIFFKMDQVSSEVERSSLVVCGFLQCRSVCSLSAPVAPCAHCLGSSVTVFMLVVSVVFLSLYPQSLP